MRSDVRAPRSRQPLDNHLTIWTNRKRGSTPYLLPFLEGDSPYVRSPRASPNRSKCLQSWRLLVVSYRAPRSR
jgi:hypothetical protein